jgi:bifunctional non-homologous end joining protein LigD
LVSQENVTFIQRIEIPEAGITRSILQLIRTNAKHAHLVSNSFEIQLLVNPFGTSSANGDVTYSGNIFYIPFDMSLTEYKKKRQFNRTHEPGGEAKSSSNKRRVIKKASAEKKLCFVVQKHQASHLHYDFRLEMRGALKSWAIPKGPSMNSEEKRLAMLVEDHPFEYKDFEGRIPEGNYGAGVVIVWDQGTYKIAEDEQQLKTGKRMTVADQEKLLIKNFYSGKLRIVLNGKKLKGTFTLMKAPQRGETSWLLIKEKDKYAKKSEISKEDKSVVSGKTIEQLAGDSRAKKWISNRSSRSKKDEEDKKAEKTPLEEPQLMTDESLMAQDEDPKDYQQVIAEELNELKKKKRASMPKNLFPMLASSLSEAFDDPEWIYEVKWDGYRALAYMNQGKVELRSRNNNSFNVKFYPVYEAVRQWPINAIIDGEIVLVNEEGLSQFHQLEDWKKAEDGELVYYVFDLLWLNGYDLMHLPLQQRRNILQRLVPEDSLVRFSESFAVKGTEFFASAEKLGIEGIIAKKISSTYEPNARTRDWLKIKTKKRHEVVIAGYTLNEGSDKKFSALIAGVYNKKHELEFIGQIGTGFTNETQQQLLKKLKLLERKTPPFKEEPVINKPTQFRRNPPKTKVHWVKPELVCEVSYQELKPGGIMRHASFQGMRTDKNAKQVIGIDESAAGG